MTTHQPVSLRLSRINQAIMHELSHLLITDVEDKNLRMVQLTKVIASKDLGSAKVYFLIADPEQDLKTVLQHLRKAAAWFRCELAKRMELRVTPELKFYYDEQSLKTQRLVTLLNKI